MKYIIFLLPLFIGFHSVQSEIVDREFRSKTGEVIKASVIEFGEDGDLLIKRTSDLQLFRVNLDIFTEDDQAFVKTISLLTTMLYPSLASLLIQKTFSICSFN